MPMTTYAELKTTLADFLNRDDSIDIEMFINLAEAVLNRDLRHWKMEARSTAEIDTKYSAIPADLLEPIRFHITSGNTNPLELISQSELLDRQYKRGNVSGNPQYYAMTAGELQVHPAPDGVYDAELYYYQKIPALSASNTTNWLLAEYPDVYLYGALVHSAPYLKEDARITTWAALYQSALDGANAASDQTKYGGSGRRLKIRAY